MANDKPPVEHKDNFQELAPFKTKGIHATMALISEGGGKPDRWSIRLENHVGDTVAQTSFLTKDECLAWLTDRTKRPNFKACNCV